MSTRAISSVTSRQEANYSCSYSIVHRIASGPRPTTWFTQKTCKEQSLTYYVPSALPLYVAMASTHHQPDPRSTIAQRFTTRCTLTRYPIASLVTAGEAFSLANRSAAQHQDANTLTSCTNYKDPTLGPRRYDLPTWYVRTYVGERGLFI